MSLNACEAYLLEIRKDEIWQLMYVQRLSERKAYEKLVQKGLGWLGYGQDNSLIMSPLTAIQRTKIPGHRS